MTDKARMFRRVSSTLRLVEADVGVLFPSHYSSGEDSATVELTVTMVRETLRVKLEVVGSRKQTVLKEDWTFAAEDLIVKEKERIT